MSASSLRASLPLQRDMWNSYPAHTLDVAPDTRAHAVTLSLSGDVIARLAPPEVKSLARIFHTLQRWESQAPVVLALAAEDYSAPRAFRLTLAPETAILLVAMRPDADEERRIDVSGRDLCAAFAAMAEIAGAGARGEDLGKEPGAAAGEGRRSLDAGRF